MHPLTAAQQIGVNGAYCTIIRHKYNGNDEHAPIWGLSHDIPMETYRVRLRICANLTHPLVGTNLVC